MSDKDFWKVRAEKYNQLYWAGDDNYQEAIIKVCAFEPDDLVLDVGTGTGIMANAMKPYVGHVVALDSSNDMLSKGEWDGHSFLKWDIRNRLFKDLLFDRIVSRMCFHHIKEGLPNAFKNCYDSLKIGGRLIIAEGIPPADDCETVNWYSEMFALKEDRITFTEAGLISHFEETGFKNVAVKKYITKDFSVKNWLGCSGLSEEVQKVIIDIHINAPQKVKELYNMRTDRDNCILDSVNIIVSGDKL